jgi:endo-1,3(4)-beta-glucanase
MLPLLPCSPYVRHANFVKEEWDTYFSNGRAEEVQGGWKGILFGNLATLNATAAWKFFTSSNFSSDWVDGGASLTWYLAYAAGRSSTDSICGCELDANFWIALGGA